MIEITNVQIAGVEAAVHGMRNPLNSWSNSDSGYCKPGAGIECTKCAATDCDHVNIPYGSFQVGKKDHELMLKLARAGSTHAKYRRMIMVYADVRAPLYWWKEFDTYKVGTVANSCSTMHKIAAKEFSLSDFSHEHLEELCTIKVLEEIVSLLNFCRCKYLETKDKKCWWQMIQLLPSSYNQMRTVMLNYETLANIFKTRRDHKLDEWQEFCRWIETLPWSDVITAPYFL